MSNSVSEVMKEKKWYLGGPMSGIPEYNFPAFKVAVEELREVYGLTVISAHEVDHGVHTGADTQPYHDYLKGDLLELLKCDGLILLQGWTDSKGANFEYEVARDLEYPIMLFTVTPNATFLAHMSKPEKFNV